MSITEKSRLMWLCGYVKGAILALWMVKKLDANTVGELEGRVDELCALVERMVGE